MASYRVIGASASETPTLLWENPNPTAAFAAQTINIDLSNYQAIGFEIKNRIDYPDRRYTSYAVRPKLDSYDALGCASSKSTANYPSVRVYSITSNQNISFSNAINTYDASVASNEFIIPLKIYGYKNALI